MSNYLTYKFSKAKLHIFWSSERSNVNNFICDKKHIETTVNINSYFPAHPKCLQMQPMLLIKSDSIYAWCSLWYKKKRYLCNMQGLTQDLYRADASRTSWGCVQTWGKPKLYKLKEININNRLEDTEWFWMTTSNHSNSYVLNPNYS